MEMQQTLRHWKHYLTMVYADWPAGAAIGWQQDGDFHSLRR
jgi:hypothetical protein